MDTLAKIKNKHYTLHPTPAQYDIKFANCVASFAGTNLVIVQPTNLPAFLMWDTNGCKRLPTLLEPNKTNLVISHSDNSLLIVKGHSICRIIRPAEHGYVITDAEGNKTTYQSAIMLGEYIESILNDDK